MPNSNIKSFPLHTSADHFFVINRGLHHQKCQQQQQALQHGTHISDALSKSFTSSDDPVSWSCVKLVRQQRADDDDTSCPICLDDFVCPRITKCGHTFCLTCLIRHLQSTSYFEEVGPKCPCCSATLHLPDARPVEFVAVQPPRLPAATSGQQPRARQHSNYNASVSSSSNKLRFVKLHRAKHCPAPYLPHPTHPRHGAPYGLPLQSDTDALYSRFSYVDPDLLAHRLEADVSVLQKRLDNNDFGSSHAVAVDDMEAVCVTLALEFVATERAAAECEAEAERELQQRYAAPSAGIYQAHPPQLLLATTTTQSDNYGVEGAEPVVFQMDEEERDGSIADSPPAMTRPRSSSVESEQLARHSSGGHRRHRSASIESETSMHTNNSATENDLSSSPPASPKTRNSRKQNNWTPGSMYLSPTDENLMYQAEDGQLCFLCGFNLQNLRTEFSLHGPSIDNQVGENKVEDNAHGPTNHRSQHTKGKQDKQQSPHRPSRRKEPLPDMVQGRVLEVEHLVLTHPVRQRLRFLSHLPLGTPVTMVELALGNVLSPATKRAFAKDFARRKNAREKKARSEQRADDRAAVLEAARIAEHRARVPLVNQAFRNDPVDVTSDAFGPALVASSPPRGLSGIANDGEEDVATASVAGASAAETSTPRSPSQQRPMTTSFSAIARKANNKKDQQRFSENDFPALGSPPTGNDFPALGSSPATTSHKKLSWTPHRLSKKKGIQ